MYANVPESFTRQPHHFGSLSPMQSSNGNRGSKKLIICGNLLNMKEKVESLLNQLGYSNYIYQHHINGEQGYLITFESSLHAKDALKNISEILKTEQFENIIVKLFEPKDERNVYVKNLPLWYTEKQLSELFQPYGSIISKKIIKKQANNNSIGFVRYAKKEEAEKAIIEINNQHLNLLGNERLVRCELSKTSSMASGAESQRLSYNSHSFNSIPQFQNFLPQRIIAQPSQYSANNIYYNSQIDHQLASQYSNMSLYQVIYYPSYGTNPPPVGVPYGHPNYSAPYPYPTHPQINHNYQNNP